MSARAMITRLIESGQDHMKFAGVYHHWNGYPASLGARLYAAIKDSFDGNLGAFLSYAIDQHPAGWSSFSVREKGQMIIEESGEAVEAFSKADKHCYCHGWRGEEAQRINGSESGLEWGYAFSEADGEMLVLERTYAREGLEGVHAASWLGVGPGASEARLRLNARFNLASDPEPDWHTLAQKKV